VSVPATIARFALLVRRSAEILAWEGPEALLARARRRMVGDDRRILWRYRAWAARHEREAPPAPRDVLASIVTPVKDPPLDVLRAMAESVLAQEPPTHRRARRCATSSRASPRATRA
jgi:hypothetical protein